MILNGNLMYILGFFMGAGIVVASHRWTNAEFLAGVILAIVVPPAIHAMCFKVRAGWDD